VEGTEINAANCEVSVEVDALASSEGRGRVINTWNI